MTLDIRDNKLVSLIERIYCKISCYVGMIQIDFAWYRPWLWLSNQKFIVNIIMNLQTDL
jgi:hypothetical protein